MKKDFIIIWKDITAKDNRKTILKVAKDFSLFLMGIYIGIFVFVKVLFWIWYLIKNLYNRILKDNGVGIITSLLILMSYNVNVNPILK